MKRILVISVLAVLLLSMVGVTMVAADPKTTVKGNVYGTDLSGTMLEKAVGKATFDTQSGAWSIATTKTLPYTDAGIYYFGITTSKPVKGIAAGYAIIDSPLYVGADGILAGSGSSVTPPSEINQYIGNGGVFILIPNSI